MEIRYVVSTMVFWWRETRVSLDSECQLLRSLSYGVELWPNLKGHHECRFEKRNWEKLAETTDGMLVTMRSRHDSPGIKEWTDQIECAKLLKAPIVASLSDLGIQKGIREGNCRLAEDIITAAQDSGVRICLETGPLQLVKEAGERFDYLDYCLDTGYANIDPDYSFQEYVDELAPGISYLHLADNYGEIDDHEPPGVRGGIAKENWDYLLKALQKHNCSCIGSLEMSPWTPQTMIKNAGKFLFDVMGWPGGPETAEAEKEFAVR